MGTPLSPVELSSVLARANAESRLGRILVLRGGAGRVPESSGTERFMLIQAMSAAAERRQRAQRMALLDEAGHLDVKG